MWDYKVNRVNKRGDKEIKQHRAPLGGLVVDFTPAQRGLKGQPVTGQREGGSILDWPMDRQAGMRPRRGTNHCVPVRAVRISAQSVSGGTDRRPTAVQLQVGSTDVCAEEQFYVKVLNLSC